MQLDSCGDFVRGQVVTILISLRDILARYQDGMTSRPILTIFDRFSKIGRSDKGSLSGMNGRLAGLARRFQVNPSTDLVSAPLEERASKSLLPQVVSGGNKRNFERAASVFVSQASRRC